MMLLRLTNILPVNIIFYFLIGVSLINISHSAEPTVRPGTVDKLNTLFTTPATRAILDDLRNSGKFDGQPVQATDIGTYKPLEINMQGVVVRSKHKPVIFINNTNTLSSHKISHNLIVQDTKTNVKDVSVPLRVKNQKLSLMPGQQWSESSNIIQDSYQVKQVQHKSDDPIQSRFSHSIDTQAD